MLALASTPNLFFVINGKRRVPAKGQSNYCHRMTRTNFWGLGPVPNSSGRSRWDRQALLRFWMVTYWEGT